ncbi:class I SAM-dependent methyltransferase [Thermodesulfobacteriota bacterium]
MPRIYLGGQRRLHVAEDKPFSFGKNWQDFLEGFDNERLRVAEDSLTEFLGTEDLKGKRFLDVGCGSGLFSYAAHNLGADTVVSFDVDIFSVECCRYLKKKAGSPEHWEVSEGSILDKGFVSTLGGFDVVYSWGVLHHTGRMWDAIEIAADLVNPGGYYYIALYNRILSRNGSTSWIHPFWTSVKKLYNAYPWFGKYVMAPPAMLAYLSLVVLRGENPVSHVTHYKSQRGMNWRNDAVDWLGGYPYEYATVEQVFKLIKSKKPQFNLANIKVTSGRGLNWFLFRNETD